MRRERERELETAHSATAAIYRSLLSNVIRFPSIRGILQNIPRARVASTRVSVARGDVAQYSILSEGEGKRARRPKPWENSLRRPSVVCSRSLIPNNFYFATVSQVGREFIEGSPGRAISTTNIAAASECFCLAFAFSDGSKTKEKKKTIAGKSEQESKIASRD